MAPEEKVAYIGQLPGQYYLSKLTDEEIKLIEGAKPAEPYLIKNVPDPELSYLTKKQRNQIIVPVRTEPKIGRNEKCPCRSDKKYKNCCLIYPPYFNLNKKRWKHTEDANMDVV